MKTFKKNYKRLYKAYLYNLKKIKYKNIKIPAEYFVDYLRFLRDFFIMTEPIVIDDRENLKMSSIASAIAEFEAYKQCAELESTTLQLATSDQTALTEKYTTDKNFHWACFWELVKLNIESWCNNYDSI